MQVYVVTRVTPDGEVMVKGAYTFGHVALQAIAAELTEFAQDMDPDAPAIDPEDFERTTVSLGELKVVHPSFEESVFTLTYVELV